MKAPGSIERTATRLLRAWEGRGIGLKAASFALVGVVNTLVDLGVFLVGHNLLGLSLIRANVLSWLVAITGSYVMNTSTTFAAESGGRLSLRDYGKFVGSGIAGVVGNTTTLVVASYWVPVLAAKLMAIGVSFLLNFSLSHFLVFRQHRHTGV